MYSIPLYRNNQRSIVLKKILENYYHTKHTNIQYYCIEKKEENSTMTIEYLPIKKMIADRLTKMLTSTWMKMLIT